MAVTSARVTACTCGGQAKAPACQLSTLRDIAFLGKAAFSNDDGSGKFDQSTLVRFDVEEIYKGLDDGTKEVWVDPGSFTSCYQQFRVGGRYLVFGHKLKVRAPSANAANDATSRPPPKPVPPGFDPAHPPAVYFSAQCDGSRPAANAAADISWLHAFVAGKTTTRVFGRVLEEQQVLFLPPKDEVGLAGAAVAIHGPKSYETASGSDGEYSFDGVPPGEYTLNVNLGRYHPEGPYAPITLAPRSCAEVNPLLVTDTEMSGVALGPRGETISGLGIQVAEVLPGGRLRHFFAIQTKTDASGRFRIAELPHGDFLLGVNLRNAPTRDNPYPTVYNPGTTSRDSAKVIHLDPAQRISSLKLVLPEPLAPRNVTAVVSWPDGTPAAGVQVFTEVGQDEPAGLVVTDAKGSAEPPCLQQLPYRIWARYFVDEDPTKANRRIMDGEVKLPPGRAPATLRIVLNKPGVLP